MASSFSYSSCEFLGSFSDSCVAAAFIATFVAELSCGPSSVLLEDMVAVAMSEDAAVGRFDDGSCDEGFKVGDRAMAVPEAPSDDGFTSSRDASPLISVFSAFED